MNSSNQSKNGFKTFLITVSLSLVVFSALYYVITDSRDNVDIEEETQNSQAQSVPETPKPQPTPAQVAANTPEPAPAASEETQEQQESVFGAMTESQNDEDETKSNLKNNSSSAPIEIENEKVLGTTSEKAPTPTPTPKPTATPTPIPTPTPQPTVEEKVPEVLASSKTTPVGGLNGDVLGGADETTQSTVPNTGSTEITIALLLASVALTIGGYFISRNPTQKALVEFENRVVRKLD